MYMMMLKAVNRTWGRVSEVIDSLEVIFRNIRVDGKAVRWDQPGALDLVLSAEDIEVDTEGLITGLYQEWLMDSLIGIMSQAEKRFMLRLFGPAHVLNNLYGMPSTWYRRLFG